MKILASPEVRAKVFLGVRGVVKGPNIFLMGFVETVFVKFRKRKTVAFALLKN